MDFRKIDDPRLDEAVSFLFSFKIGDIVTTKQEPFLRGEIRDGIYVGELPKAAAGSVGRRGKTLYEIAASDQSLYIVDESDLEKVSG
jgi:hypothetical protein